MIGTMRCNFCKFEWEATVPDSKDMSGVTCPQCKAKGAKQEAFWPPFVDVGNGTYANKFTEFYVYKPGERIKIGKFCSLGSEAIIMTGGNHNYHLVSTSPFDKLRNISAEEGVNRSYQTTRDTELGNDVWVGNQAMIGGGAHIGDGCVIGARAVVFSDVAPYSIVIGNPGVVIKRRFDDRTIQRLLKLKWWDWPMNTIFNNLDWFYKPVPVFLAHFGG
jgi:acetyltransferase-like isoleucine patch superfamily enzyme